MKKTLLTCLLSAVLPSASFAADHDGCSCLSEMEIVTRGISNDRHTIDDELKRAQFSQAELTIIKLGSISARMAERSMRMYSIVCNFRRFVTNEIMQHDSNRFISSFMRIEIQELLFAQREVRDIPKLIPNAVIGNAFQEIHQKLTSASVASARCFGAPE